MESVLLYLGKVIFCSGVTFLYYQLSLKDKTFHHYNRFYLLSAMLVSLLLPLIKVEDFTIRVSSTVYKLIEQVQNFNEIKNSNNDYIYLRIIFSALGLVSFCFLGRFVHGIFRIHQLKNQFEKESFYGINFYRTNLTETPFSYFNNLFWRNSITMNSETGKQILKHEMVHIEQKHSFDKIFIEIVGCVFWFNPFFHLIKKEISLIHEYLADKKAVKQSDTKAFAQMLLAGHFSGNQFPAVSPFLSSNLKKRLTMLQKPQTKFGYARRILALPVVFSLAFAYLVSCQNEEIKNINVSVTDTTSNDKVSFNDRVASASENALFIINSERKTKKEFLNFLRNNNHKKLATAYSGSVTNDDDHLVFGAIEKKYGVFSVDDIEKMDDKSIKKYHQLIKEINPKWYYDQIINGKYNKGNSVKVTVAKS
ncbi:BlaR1 peptidase M56 [Chryseobacterium arachidis]|uniref:BlaR1 peptidase M56 n=1 Tax=Chryseobacterium arachidis TaxID=1416778 RepID=A0A1M5BMI0_9FLAO|nr:M56 family metallopeptidase [Chryseobacterium arachidis]SHF43744.1 BlaR1 peptidase M56 [Chryseobacterium arachidis]